jgi:hypothetical protein
MGGETRSEPSREGDTLSRVLPPRLASNVIPGLTGNPEHTGQRCALDPRFHGDDKQRKSGMTNKGNREDE